MKRWYREGRTLGEEKTATVARSSRLTEQHRRCSRRFETATTAAAAAADNDDDDDDLQPTLTTKNCQSINQAINQSINQLCMLGLYCATRPEIVASHADARTQRYHNDNPQEEEEEEEEKEEEEEDEEEEFTTRSRWFRLYGTRLTTHVEVTREQFTKKSCERQTVACPCTVSLMLLRRLNTAQTKLQVIEANKISHNVSCISATVETNAYKPTVAYLGFCEERRGVSAEGATFEAMETPLVECGEGCPFPEFF